MNQKVLETLEYHKILERLEGYADSEEGKKRVHTLRPSSDRTEIEGWQEETAAAVRRVRAYGSLGFGGLRDLAPALKRLSIAASLSIPELLTVKSVLLIAGRAKSYGQGKDGAACQDALSRYFSAVEALPEQSREISRCILSEEEIADDASSGLSDVRRKLRKIQDRIHGELNAVLNRSRSMLQEPVITMRDGRYCLPVKAEHKSGFSGIVHDLSATGSTVFMEPTSVLRLNNEQKQLEAEEKQEVEKVLMVLSDSLRPHTDALLLDVDLLSHLDFVFAKARMAEEMEANRPDFHEDFHIRLLQARHPLIAREQVVPVSVELGKAFSMLIITGPNTGGKTVLLKTIGLFQLMGQAGLFIPAFEGSELGIFTEIFADIGDEQSIEQSLSTFSAHTRNTVRILAQADAHSLCLFDELGAGTDPTEGAALAMAILQFLHNMETRTVATTHYAEVKVYALSTEGVENASCEFDVETLRPTYRVLLGVPGKSNAFAIAQKLGMPEYIIEDARQRLASEDVKFEDVIASLEESRRTAERERAEIEQYKAEIAAYKQRARESSKGVEKGRDKILQNAREEAARILQDAKETADRVVKELRRQELQGAATMEAEKTRSELNKKLRETQGSLSQGKVKGPSKPISAKKLRVGDTVRVLSLGLTATVSTLPDKDGMLYVTAGILRSKVGIRDLERLEDPAPGASYLSGGKQKSGKGGAFAGGSSGAGAGRRSGSASIGLSKSLAVSPELNLIGMTTMEAQPELSKYLDDAYLAHLPEVRIVHGRGTGALKKMVQQELRRNRYVESFRLGEYGEGSDGVTIVFFK